MVTVEFSEPVRIQSMVAVSTLNMNVSIVGPHSSYPFEWGLKNIMDV